MPPFIFRHVLLDHQSACKEHGHTIIKKHFQCCIQLSTIRNKSTFWRFFFPVLQLVGIEITYEGVERNLGVKNRRNYAKIVVVNRSAHLCEEELFTQTIFQF